MQLTTDLAIDPDDDALSVATNDQWVAFTTGIDTDLRVGIVSVDGDEGVIYPRDAAMYDPRWAPEPPPDTPTPSEPPPSSDTLGDNQSIGSTWTVAAIPAVPGRPEGIVEAVTAGDPGFVALGQGCDTSGDQDACEVIVGRAPTGARGSVRPHPTPPLRARRTRRTERPAAGHVRRGGWSAWDCCDRLCSQAEPAGHDLVLAGRVVVGAHLARPRGSDTDRACSFHPCGRSDLGWSVVRGGGRGPQQLHRTQPRQGEGAGGGLDLVRRSSVDPRAARYGLRRRRFVDHRRGPVERRDARRGRRALRARRDRHGVYQQACRLPARRLDLVYGASWERAADMPPVPGGRPRWRRPTPATLLSAAGWS